MAALPRDTSAQAIPYFGWDGTNNCILLSAPAGGVAFALSDAMDNPITSLLGVANTLYNPSSGKWERVHTAGSLDNGLYSQAGVSGAVPLIYDPSASKVFMASAASAGDAVSGIRVPIAGGYLYNGATWDAQRTANQAQGTSGTGLPGFGGLLYDGTNWVRPVNAGGDGKTSSQTPLATVGLVDGSSTISRWATPNRLSAGAGGTGIASVATFDYNGSTFDPHLNNVQGTLLASAARTSTTDTAQQTNYNHRGIRVYLNITVASGTGGLQVALVVVDPISGATSRVSVFPTAITATGLSTHVWYPAATASDNFNYNQILPRIYIIRVNHNDGSSYTYSLGYSLLP